MPRSALIFGTLACWLGLAAASQAFPDVKCALNADRSSVVVLASYPADSLGNEYSWHGDVTCQTACLVKPAGENRFSSFQCQFPLNVNAAEKIVCEQKGAGPDAFVEVRSKEVMCVPRK